MHTIMLCTHTRAHTIEELKVQSFNYRLLLMEIKLSLWMTDCE